MDISMIESSHSSHEEKNHLISALLKMVQYEYADAKKETVLKFWKSYLTDEEFAVLDKFPDNIDDWEI